MVREITMFELHFDGARFGPSFGSEEDDASDDEHVDADVESDEESSGGSKLKPLVAVAGLVLVVMAIRRLRSGGDEEDYDIPIGEESESVSAEP